MVTPFVFPDVGEGITEGEVVEWLVKEGDKVKEDQNIVKVETDKAVVDLPAPTTGTILKIYKKAGETVKVGENLVDIGESGEKTSTPVKKETAVETPKKTTHKMMAKPAKKVSEKPTKKKSQSVVGELEEAPDEEEEVGPKPKKKVTVNRAPRVAGVKAMPAVRKLAQELGVDLSTIKGTGPEGRVLAKDLKSAMGSVREGSPAPEAKPAEPSAAPKIKVVKKYDMYGYVDRIPLKGVRKAISKNMMEQAALPMVTHMDEIDVTKLWALRKRELKIMPEGVKLTFLPFIIKAMIVAAKKYPIVYGAMGEEEIVIKKYHNYGIAVATPEGLMVPILKGADQKNMIQIAEEIQTLADKARKRKLDIMDMRGGSITITNVGSIGGLFATPILNPGESSIIALGRIYDKPMVFGNRIKSIRVRKVLPISLTFDHRIYDGAVAAQFVNAFKEYLEDPEFLLLDLV